MKPCDYHQIQLRMVEINQNCFNAMKKRMVWILGIIFVSLVFQTRSHFNQHEDIQYLKNSLSKLYQDFDKSMLTDLASMKEFLESAMKSQPLIELNEIQKASKKVGHQIETLQSFVHDKTGRLDLALRNSGGKIAGIEPETKVFYSCNFFMKMVNCPFRRNGPEKLIEPLVHYGEFFRFKGKQVSVSIKLISKAFLDSVTIEHIPRRMSPNEEVTSAPRNFSVSVSIYSFLSTLKGNKNNNKQLSCHKTEKGNTQEILFAFKRNLIKISSFFSFRA